MIRFLASVVLIVWGSVGLAQGLDGRAERLLEEQLSGPGREVDITGFAGAISTRATFDRLTMSDAQGVWLVLEGAVLDWTASALLRGRLQVDELSATRLELSRMPISQADPVAASEASGLRIPNLPVVIDIGRAALQEIHLGAPVLGTAVVARFEGAAKLEAGGLDIELTSKRLDGPGGQADIALSFVPGTEALRINADIREPAGGVVARALDLPGLPSVELTIAGDGILDAFSSTVRLATDGAERFGGAVNLSREEGGDRQFAAILNGDIRPLLPTENRGFFGPNTEVSVSGRALSDGALELDALEIGTARLTLEGQGALAADGAPERLLLSGRLQGDLPGGSVTLQDARLSLQFDASQGPDWAFGVIAQAVQFPGGTLQQADLQGTGTLKPATAAPFTGEITLTASGLALDDAALRDAIGPNATLRTGLSLVDGGRFALNGLQLDAAHLSARGTVTAEPTEGRLALEARLSGQIPDLGALGSLVAPLQAGEAGVDISLSTEMPGGALAIDVSGQTRGLDIGQTALQTVLDPETDISLSVTRDETGTRIEAFALKNTGLNVSGQGNLSTEDGSLTFAGTLFEPKALVPDLPGGTLRMTGRVEDLVTEPRARLTLLHDTGTQARATATLSGDLARFDITLEAPALAPFSAVLGPVEQGQAEAIITGQANTRTGTLDLRMDAVTRAISIGVAELAPLIAPETKLSATVRRSASGDITIDPITLRNDEISARASGKIAADGPENGQLTATLKTPSLFLEGLPQGAVRLIADMTELSRSPTAKLALIHDSGTRADITATLSGPDVAFNADLDSPTLAPFARLLGPVQAGVASVQATGQANTETGVVSARITANTNQIKTDIAQVAAVLRPATQLTASVERQSDGAILVRNARVQNAELTADASARLSPSGLEQADLTAEITDFARVVPDLPGRFAITASVAGDQVTADISSASGVEAQIAGRIGQNATGVDIMATGRVPLALASPFIGNRSLSGSAAFDLGIRGPAQMQSVSGQITTGDLRLADPELGLVLSPASARIDLSGGRAQISLQGALNDAPLEINGGLSLVAPYQTDMRVALRSLDYAVQDFARVNLSADLTLSGAAQSQLAIAGDVRLGQTEIRVPDGGVGAADPLPPVRHVGTPADAQRTLARAGLLGGTDAGGGAGVRLPLDLTIRATEPIFVRGRGLDAEFGGAFQVGGTVANPVPTGQFSLRRGRLSLLGQRLDLTRGEITATGGLIPELDIEASSKRDNITAQVLLAGPADAPELTLTSQPELPQDEILARLLFGRDVSSLSAFQVAQLVSSLATLTSGRPTLLDQSRRAFGVDDLDIRTDARTGEAELAIGNYISDNIYSEVEIGAQGDTQVNLNLDLTDNTRVRGSVNSDGNTGIGVFWERDY